MQTKASQTKAQKVVNQPKQETTTDTDIKTIKVVLGDANLNEANDKLVLDTELALNADIAKHHSAKSLLTPIHYR
jgi:hypothetical protein